MMNSNAAKTIAVLMACILTALIYFLPNKTVIESKFPLPGDSEIQASDYFDELQSRQEKNLDEGLRSKLEKWKADLASSPGSHPELYDSVAAVWDAQNLFALSAFWFERKAQSDQSENSFLNAAYRYFDAMKHSVDTSVKKLMTDKAIAAYSRVLELNPKNLNAKSDLGVLYAEGTSEPMKGITMLREVVAENPKHEMAQLNLGLLSYKSNQFEKALERFDKVLEINPGRIDMHIYKAQTYRQMNQPEKAIAELETFITLTDNKDLIAQAVTLIEEMKSARK